MTTKIKIDVPKDQMDHITEAIGFIALILLLALPIYYYSQLPETIPIHFNLKGEADGFGSRRTIWILPIIGAITFLSLFFLNKVPHLFNYPIKITQENALRQYTITTKMMRTINALIVCVFAFITHRIIQTGLGIKSGLGVYFAPLFLLVIFSVIGYYLYQSIKSSRNSEM